MQLVKVKIYARIPINANLDFYKLKDKNLYLRRNMQSSRNKFRARLHEVIFESGSAAGKAFDVALLILILFSVGIVMLDSVKSFHSKYGDTLYVIEWILTIIFSIEYILRLISVKSPVKYAKSWLGVIDLLAILPMYLSVMFMGAQSLLVLRALRILRVFRIFRLTHYLTEMRFLSQAIKNSLKKISIFILAVLMLVIVFGSIMYLVEGGTNGFESIPVSIYWAIVTITTVGYGDISPITPLGKMIASAIMLLGYGIIAVPTGIITSEMALASRNLGLSHQVCPGCGYEGHDLNAEFCKLCGEKL